MKRETDVIMGTGGDQRKESPALYNKQPMTVITEYITN